MQEMPFKDADDIEIRSGFYIDMSCCNCLFYFNGLTFNDFNSSDEYLMFDQLYTEQADGSNKAGEGELFEWKKQRIYRRHLEEYFQFVKDPCNFVNLLRKKANSIELLLEVISENALASKNSIDSIDGVANLLEISSLFYVRF